MGNCGERLEVLLSSRLGRTIGKFCTFPVSYQGENNKRNRVVNGSAIFFGWFADFEKPLKGWIQDFMKGGAWETPI